MGSEYLNELFGVAGKHALVTGGATGIGLMIAEALVRGGAKVSIASRKADACDNAANQLNQLQAAGSAEGFAGDVGSESGILALAQRIKDDGGTLDILVNNAGVTWGQPLESFPYAAWEKVMAINVAGMFTLTRELLPCLVARATPQDPSRIINLGSVMGTRPMAEMSYSYAASKAAVHHLTHIMANEFAAKNITCNAFAPGPFRSKMTAFATEDPRRAEIMASRVPLGRLGAPTDIAAATLYLCGPGGAYVSGAVLPIDGGLHAMAGTEMFPRE